MSLRKLLPALLGVVMVLPLVAQQTPPAAPAPAPSPAVAPASTVDGGEPTYFRPETLEERKARLGTAEDPGPNPDPEKHYFRFGKSFHIERFDRKWAKYGTCDDQRYLRPFGFVNVCKELYQQNDKYVWVWMEDVDPADEPPPVEQLPVEAMRYSEKAVDFMQKMRNEFTELLPPVSNTTIRFEEASSGLPTSGSWRNSVAVVDMNEDGHLDIVAPPERAGRRSPTIFLGDSKGTWKEWTEVKWPYGIDYGAVASGDFNRDGHADLAFAVHLRGVYVFLGDGKGQFRDVVEGLPRNFPTRRLTVTDVDRDGAQDIVVISEGPTAAGNTASPEHGKLRVYYNRKKGTAFEGSNIADPTRYLGGDWLTVGNFNGDKYPDFLAASVFFGGIDTVWMSKSGQEWSSLGVRGSTIIPEISYYFANATGSFTGKKVDDAVISFVRFWPGDYDEKYVTKPALHQVAGLDLMTFDGERPRRVPIMRWGSNFGVWGLGAGDFNGDRKSDVMFTRFNPRDAVLLLGDGSGKFERARVEGITVRPNTSYDLKVADVNADGRPDVIVTYETSGSTAFAARDGSIQVFLNRGVVKK